MFYKIDYFAFTIPTRAPFEGAGKDTQDHVINAFVSLFDNDAVGLRNFEAWTLEAAKGFYHSRFRHNATGTALSIGTVNAHIFCELSGKSCDALESVSQLEKLVTDMAERATRLDFAIDLESTVQPEAFAAFRNTKKWKYAPTYPSASGCTVYVGSRTGERMARVYRYNPPHPRAHLLRVEAEYKGKAAKTFAARLASVPLSTLVIEAHAPFGWTHEVWESANVVGVSIPYKPYTTTNASTIRWLYGDVLGAIKKAAANDLIDLEEYIRLLRE